MSKILKTELPPLSAEALKATLWSILEQLKDGKISIDEVTATAAISREITRTINVQLKIAAQTGREVTNEVISFSEN